MAHYKINDNGEKELVNQTQAATPDAATSAAKSTPKAKKAAKATEDKK